MSYLSVKMLFEVKEIFIGYKSNFI